jgi:hypothetical protein
MEIPKKYKIKNKIWIEDEMFYSEAFSCLTASEIKTLMRCLQKRKWETGRKRKIIYTDDGFVFPYAEAAALSIAKNTQYWKNINKLIGVGFLDLLYQGGWYQKHEREKDYSVYKNSERWRNYGTADFVKAEKKKTLPKSFHIREHLLQKKLKSTSLKRSRQLHKSEDDRLKTDNDRLHNNEGDNSDQKIPESIVNSA